MGNYPAGLILIVTGSVPRAEQMDRPLAYFLQSRIDELAGGTEDRGALVLSDRYFLSQPDLHRLPLISVGGPGVNRVALRLLRKLSCVLKAEDKFFIQMDPERKARRASVGGLDNPQTRVAVVTFADRYLPAFVRQCWERSASS